MLNKHLDLLAEGMNLDKGARRIVIRVLWVLLVTIHMAYMWGFFTWFGWGAPYAKAEDVEALTKKVSVAARLALVQELRQQSDLLGQTEDLVSRQIIYKAIDRLCQEYTETVPNQDLPRQCINGH